MFLINHWLRPDGPPDPVEAGHVNSRKVLLDRFRTCAREPRAAPERARGRLHRDRRPLQDRQRAQRRDRPAERRRRPTSTRRSGRRCAAASSPRPRRARSRGYRRLPRISAREGAQGPGTRRGVRAAARSVLDEFECENGIAEGPRRPVRRRSPTKYRSGRARARPSGTTSTTARRFGVDHDDDDRRPDRAVSRGSS